MKRNLFFVTASVLALSATAAMAGGNNVILNQYDSSQTATIDQTGSSNTIGTYNAWSGFEQNNGGLGGYNDLKITQGGNGNSVGRDSKGYQSGEVNTAVITQDGLNSDIELQQSGIRNGQSVIDGTYLNKVGQNGTANESKAEVKQSGSYNLFDVAQGGYRNNVYVYQADAANSVTIKQALYNDGTYGNSFNRINSQQTGNWNKGEFSQIGSYNQIDSVQYGNEKATIYQIGSNNQSTGYQTGGGNVVNIQQGVDGYAYGTNNYANYAQAGSGHQLTLTQTGDNNRSYTNQSGVGSKATITQR